MSADVKERDGGESMRPERYRITLLKPRIALCGGVGARVALRDTHTQFPISAHLSVALGFSEVDKLLPTGTSVFCLRLSCE